MIGESDTFGFAVGIMIVVVVARSGGSITRQRFLIIIIVIVATTGRLAHLGDHLVEFSQNSLVVDIIYVELF